MKNLKLISILLITLFAFSCKKDKTSTTNKQAELTVYKNTANSNDELMATYNDPNTSSISYIYGSTNSEGRGTVAKSMVYEKNGNDTLINIILDADSRPIFLYVSTRAGVKINQLFKFEYVTGDSIKVSFYKYNWLDGTDSLMAQYVSKDNNGRTLYGARVAATNVEGEWLLAISVGVTIGVLCPIAAGLIVGLGLKGGTIAGALTAAAYAYAVWSGTANGATLSPNLPPYPTSPTSVQIPNPIGTPSNPTGNNGTTVTDIDGNVYNVVKIGNQYWMKENLKTTRYNDGIGISNVTDNALWHTFRTGAFCYYNDDISNNSTYGKLYNWYAVETGKLAPAGWHVPTDAEWTTLTTYLGGESVAGGKMKATTLWNSPNTGATNSSGFTGLPAGFRGDDGAFSSIGEFGDFWSSTAANTRDALFRSLAHFNADADRPYFPKRHGYSVRCVRD